MEMRFEELMKQITDFILSEAKTETVIGEVFKLGEFSCVPVIKVGMGFGSGGGEGIDPKNVKGQGAGAGAGVSIEPIGFLVTRGEAITFLSSGKSSGITTLMDKLPEVIEKFAAKKKELEPAGTGS